MKRAVRVKINGQDYQLADSKCHATGSAADCGAIQARQLITLTPNTTTAGKLAQLPTDEMRDGAFEADARRDF